nr:hypothetical protein [uncultured Oscillibacter sp.]
MSDNNPKEIRFIDRFYNTLFMLPDGGNIIRTTVTGYQEVLTCTYIGPCYARFGYSTFHICQFAEIQDHQGAVYAPEHPRDGDICDTYSIYRPKYRFYTFSAKPRIMDFDKVHAGVLAPNITLETILFKHSPYTSDHWIREISTGDIIVLSRSGIERAYRIDLPNVQELSFDEVKKFFAPRPKAKGRLEQER